MSGKVFCRMEGGAKHGSLLIVRIPLRGREGGVLDAVCHVVHARCCGVLQVLYAGCCMAGHGGRMLVVPGPKLWSKLSSLAFKSGIQQ